MPEKHYRRPAVEEITGLSRSLIYAKLDRKSRYYDPSFPRPVRLGQRAVAWPAAAITAWLESRSAA